MPLGQCPSHPLSVYIYITKEFLDPPPLPAKVYPPLDRHRFLPIPHSPYVCVVMVTVQGWANVQLQFDRLVHFECKPRPRKTLCFKYGAITKSTRVLVEESKEPMIWCQNLWVQGTVLPLASQVTFGNALLFSMSVSSMRIIL